MFIYSHPVFSIDIVLLSFCLKLPDPAIITELEHKVEEKQKENNHLKEKLAFAEEELETCKMRHSRAQMDVKSLQDSQQEQEEANTRLKEKLSRLEVGHISHTQRRKCSD